MSASKNQFGVVMVGNLRYPRYAIVDNRRPDEPTRFWTGDLDQPWSVEVARAVRWADYNAVLFGVQEVGRHEYRHLPERRFTLTLNVSLIADDSVTPEMVTEYLDRALTLQVDYQRQGMGPVRGSLVFLEVCTDRLIPSE